MNRTAMIAYVRARGFRPSWSPDDGEDTDHWYRDAERRVLGTNAELTWYTLAEAYRIAKGEK